MGTKQWWKSRTILAGIFVIARGIYEALVATLPAIGVTIPPVPPAIDAIVGAILGQQVIKGRMDATKRIG